MGPAGYAANWVPGFYDWTGFLDCGYSKKTYRVAGKEGKEMESNNGKTKCLEVKVEEFKDGEWVDYDTFYINVKNKDK